MTHYARRTEDGTLAPVSLSQLKSENPGISFPAKPSSQILGTYGLVAVEPAEDDEIAEGEVLGDHEIVEDQGRVVRRRRKRSLTREERRERRRARKEARKNNREKAMREYAWPVFFEWQLGRATEQDWRDAVAEVEAWYPDEAQS